jgi:phage terminase small subunit
MGAQSLVMKELAGKDRLKAAELLGKRYAMWTDKKEIEGNIGVTIVDDLDDDED